MDRFAASREFMSPASMVGLILGSTRDPEFMSSVQGKSPEKLPKSSRPELVL
jgi:hypothetical protein